MSPTLLAACLTTTGFPRVSGDEPPGAFVRETGIWFSPRERG